MTRSGVRAFLVSNTEEGWCMFAAATSASKARHLVAKTTSTCLDSEIGELYPYLRVRRVRECDHLCVSAAEWALWKGELGDGPIELDWRMCAEAMGWPLDEYGELIEEIERD